MIKTFRGQMADLAQDTIVLHTKDGATGYRIVKFELIALQPGQTDYEHVVQIWKVPKTDTAKYDEIYFNDQTLIGVAYIKGDVAETNTDTRTVIFDREIFNQDIYITHAEVKGALAVNYYIELEQIKLDLNESTVATLKDIRNLEYPPAGG